MDHFMVWSSLNIVQDIENFPSASQKSKKEFELNEILDFLKYKVYDFIEDLGI